MRREKFTEVRNVAVVSFEGYIAACYTRENIRIHAHTRHRMRFKGSAVTSRLSGPLTGPSFSLHVHLFFSALSFFCAEIFKGTRQQTCTFFDAHD